LLWSANRLLDLSLELTELFGHLRQLAEGCRTAKPEAVGDGRVTTHHFTCCDLAMDAALGACDCTIADHGTIGDAHLSGKNHSIPKAGSAGNAHL
tara:strand:+ start:272 stop:556 length:285 start_codon:yes stop_codon:yes gene_type:complete